MRRSALLTALAAALLTLPTAAVAQDDPAELLEEGRDRYEEGDFEAARERLWAYLDATTRLTGASRLPQADALFMIALMEPDAAVAARHYDTIVEEYPASTVADQALLRLGQYALVQDRSEEARQRFERLRREYPYSRIGPEIPLWIGRSYLSERRPDPAITAFLEGYSRLRDRDLAVDVPRRNAEALEAEYAWWLASAFRDVGDLESATRYYELLATEYPDAPQAGEARDALVAVEGRAGGEIAMTDPGIGASDEPVPDIGAHGAPAEGGPPAASGAPDATPGAGERPEWMVDEGETGAADEWVPRPAEPEAETMREVAETAREPERARAEPVPQAIEEPVPQPAREPAAETPPRDLPEGTGAHWLQVGAFSSASGAAEVSKRLKADGFETRVEIGIVEGQGFYRVRVGPYALPAEAARMAEARDRLEGLGYPTRQVAAND